MALAVAAASGGLAAAAYLDGKHQLRREVGGYLNQKKLERAYARRLEEGTLSLWYDFAATCKRQPNDRAVWTRERSWTFKELHDQTVQFAQWMLDEGIRPGDLVAIYLRNSAEFIMATLATQCIGAGPAWINYNLEGKALTHCLDVCESKVLIADPDQGCQQRVEGNRQQIEAAGTKIVTLDSSFLQQLRAQPVVVPEDRWRRDMKPEFPFALIYTSGTTGLPKGCPFILSRSHMTGHHIDPNLGGIRGKDCWYSPMPLYHGTGGLSTMWAVIGGVGVALTPRFSVSRFWPDICDSGSTFFIYVGETARYLLAAPPHPLERAHNIRCVFGNGMRPDVWQKFQERFNIPEVLEFFNSSEGVFTLSVWARGPYLRGSVGHHGLLNRARFQNTYIPVHIDHDTGDIWRDPKTGFAKRTSYEEGGEMLVAVPGKEAFGGYWRNESATNKRFATNVFKEGDLYYRSGDALRRGSDGHWHFLDRLGDTFRWKSENVSTAEVALTLGRYPGVAEANVYGVEIPGHEGRAGCAALNCTSSTLDYKDLLRYARAELPRYAVPIFLRIVKSSSHIHNHKQNKVGLRKEGVDPEKLGTEEKEGVNDMFLWLDPERDMYTPFERAHWDRLAKNEIRL